MAPVYGLMCHIGKGSACPTADLKVIIQAAGVNADLPAQPHSRPMRSPLFHCGRVLFGSAVVLLRLCCRSADRQIRSNSAPAKPRYLGTSSKDLLVSSEGNDATWTSFCVEAATRSPVGLSVIVRKQQVFQEARTRMEHCYGR